MQQKFFTNTIQSKLIKNLLLNTALPLYNSVRDGDYVIKDICYLYNRSLIKCTKSGIINSENSEEAAVVDTLKTDFIFGRDYIKNTQIFSSTSNFYDSDTHRYLGDYLRFFRDIFKIDLMPFYNCFNGKYTSKFYIVDNHVQQLRYDYYQQGSAEFNSKYNKKENFKVLQIPIKFNKIYTIALDSMSNISIAPCFIEDSQLLSTIRGSENVSLTENYINTYNNIYNFSSLQFNNPFTVTFKNIDTTNGNAAFFQRYEKYLYMLIQLPESNNSSVVVLEGDYTNTKCNYIFDVENVYDIDNITLDKLCLSGLSLLTLNDETRYPFADRLIEYLLWNVIDYTEDIAENVTRIQRRVGINLDNHVKGYYDEYLRARVYSLFRDSNKYTNLDSNGFVDKNVEAFLFK